MTTVLKLFNKIATSEYCCYDLNLMLVSLCQNTGSQKEMQCGIRISSVHSDQICNTPQKSNFFLSLTIVISMVLSCSCEPTFRLMSTHLNCLRKCNHLDSFFSADGGKSGWEISPFPMCIVRVCVVMSQPNSWCNLCCETVHKFLAI